MTPFQEGRKVEDCWVVVGEKQSLCKSRANMFSGLNDTICQGSNLEVTQKVCMLCQ